MKLLILPITLALFASFSTATAQVLMDPLVVKVVDESGHAAEGCQVFALGNTAGSAEYSRLSHLEDDRVMADVVMRLGETATTDEDGKARFHPPEAIVNLVAKKGDGFAYGRSDEMGDGDLVLTLERDQHITVQVLDLSGAPRAHVPVAMYTFFEGMDQSIYSPGGSSWSRPTRGDDGTITIEHAQCYLSAGGNMPAHFKIGLAVPQRDLRMVEIDPKALPKDKLILRLPEVGSVTLKMADAPESFARMRPLPADDGGVFSHGVNSFWSNYSPTHATFEHGVAHFPFVEIGLELQVQAWWKDAVDWASLVHAGPTKPGEDLVLEIDAAHGPGGLVVGENDVLVLEGQDVLQPRAVFLTSSSFDNDRFALCFVPSDMGKRDSNRHLSLRVGKDIPEPSGWHSVDGEPVGHFTFHGLDQRQVQLAAKKFGVPIVRLGPRPYKLESKFTLDKTVYAPRTPAQLRMKVDSVGERAFSANFGGWQRNANRHARFDFTITKERQPIPDIGRTISLGGLSSPTVIKPHDNFEEQVQLDQWCAFDSPGVYEVDVRYELHVVGTGLEYVGGKACAGPLNEISDLLRGHVQVVVQ